MDLLQRAFTEELDRNETETFRWTQYKEQHEGAKRNLQDFQKSLEIDIMVPIGTKALIPGRIYHTNEIIVSHSGTYYSKCSTHKAMEICQHRLKIAANRLEGLKAEAEMYRNKLELPTNYDAFSSHGAEEIIETYDEEEEKRWRDDHRKKMKEHKQREAEERRKLVKTEADDDVIQRLDELELMEELENELEAVNDVDDETIRAILDDSVYSSSKKIRISHLNDERSHDQEISNNDDALSRESESLSSESEDVDSDDDDVPMEFKEIEHKAKSMSKREKLKLFKVKLAEVQDYLQNCKPKNMEEISIKTDKMFLSDHLLSVIETIEDEINCDQYLNGESIIGLEKESSNSSTTLTASILPHNKPSQTKPILKTNGSKTDPQRRISFALEDDVKSFDGREEPSKISTTIKYEHGPVIKFNINHSETKLSEANEDSDVIRSPADIYKRFAEYKLVKTNEEEKPVDYAMKESNTDYSVLDKNQSSSMPSLPITDHVFERKKPQTADQDVIEAKTEVKERRISFALEDDVKSFDGREEPSKISTTIKYEHGPVIKFNINHSETKLSEANEDSDVIRSPADIYKRFAEYKLVKTNEEEKPVDYAMKESNTDYSVLDKNQSSSMPSLPITDHVFERKKPQTADQDVIEAKTEVKEILDNIFGNTNSNEPDPLPAVSFVDAHAPKKRISLFKARREAMKNK